MVSLTLWLLVLVINPSAAWREVQVRKKKVKRRIILFMAGSWLLVMGYELQITLVTPYYGFY
jgi:hypothetical protein